MNDVQAQYLLKKKKKRNSISLAQRGKTTPPHTDRERDKVNRE